MSDTRTMSEIMRHSEPLVDGDDGVVRSIRDVPVTEQRKPFINSKRSRLQHTGMFAGGMISSGFANATRHCSRESRPICRIPPRHQALERAALSSDRSATALRLL